MSLQNFHPTVQRWFSDTLGEPSAPQRLGWPAILGGGHALIAAPTGSGKTLAAFLCALDGLLRQSDALPEQTAVLYVSPLKALSNDVQKNLAGPLAALRALDPSLPEVRVLVRTGDTPARDRARMGKAPPHILVTTPESLYVMLTSDGGRRLLSGVRTVIVDEIHALAGNRRGAHLSLSLERLVALAGEVQRIGLSATVKPLDEIARFLVGTGREATVIDAGHLRQLDLSVEVPESPLEAVCSHQTWEEIYRKISALISEHRTTLVFTNTRKLAERIAVRLGEAVGRDQVTSHHGSLSRERRLEAEMKLKAGQLRALVATASLELGIDIGEVDLVVQVGVPNAIGTLLQRVGRAGHGKDRVPKGRIFPLTPDDLAVSAALVRAVRQGDLDRIEVPVGSTDMLAQQVVAAAVAETWEEQALYEALRRAWPYRNLARGTFDDTLALHAEGRLALLHRDSTTGRVRATRRARLVALVGGGAIPDQADYQVLLEPENIVIGSVHEDFAVESNAGDVFQLGAQSWRILKVDSGKVRVADAGGVPPSLPFWIGESPARTPELSASLSEIRTRGLDAAWLEAETGLDAAGASQLAAWLAQAQAALGAMPTVNTLVAERFFDETGGMQLVIHCPLGARINRAFGLALRKRICRGFGFELQAAANDEAIVISLGPMHSFPLEEIFSFLHPDSACTLLIQALLAAPMFETRWRWNVTRSLVVARGMGGKRVPPQLLRARAQDALASAFPEVVACGENLPPGDLPVPLEHPLVAQTVDDCLREAMDVDGLVALLQGIRSGAIRTHAVDNAEPSLFCAGILQAKPYAFLDDAPLEERRTQFVRRPAVGVGLTPLPGLLDPAAVATVRAEAWPDARDAEELHEALGWMGYLADEEVGDWGPWLGALAAAGRVVHEGRRWFATDASRDPRDILRGRLDALGPVFSDDPLLGELESSGEVLRVSLEGRAGWCNRRLLARIHRVATERRRADIAPLSAAEFLRFLARWQHVEPAHRLDGPNGLREVLGQLSGVEAPAWAWERHLLPERVAGYRRDWLDGLALSGEVVWARLWGEGAGSLRNTPIGLLPRADLRGWMALAPPVSLDLLGGPARALYDLLCKRGASFAMDLRDEANLLPSYLEQGLSELVARGLATCDGVQPLRSLLIPPSERRPGALGAGGRWGLLPRRAADSAEMAPDVDFILDRLLARYGVLFRKLLARERQPVPWRDLVRALRLRELRGEVVGGYLVTGISGEQYALPAAVAVARRMRKDHGETPPMLQVAAADPLNLLGILTPDERVSSMQRGKVMLTGGEVRKAG